MRCTNCGALIAVNGLGWAERHECSKLRLALKRIFTRKSPKEGAFDHLKRCDEASKVRKGSGDGLHGHPDDRHSLIDPEEDL